MLFGINFDVTPRILLVCDSATNRQYISAQLLKMRGDALLSSTEDLGEASALLRRHSFDLIVLAVDSFQKEQIFHWIGERKRLVLQRLIPIVMVTANKDPTTRIRLIETGSDSIVTRPVSAEEFRAVADTQLQRKFMTDQLEHVEQVVMGLVHTIDARDDHTAGHTQRVTHLSVRLADAMGLDLRRRGIVYAGSLMHDIGKIGIPDNILKKEGKLTDAEFRIIQRHPVIGAEILKPLRSLNNVLQVVRHHHERWDGRGYPDGLAGPETALEARIVSVADSIDAMLSHRPYRPGLPADKVRQTLLEFRGSQWDPDLVQIAMEIDLIGTGAELVEDESFRDGFQQPPRNAVAWPT